MGIRGGDGRTARDRFRPVLCLGLILLLFVPLLVAAEPREEGGANERASNYLLSINAMNATQKVDLTSPARSATFGFQAKNTGDSGTPYLDMAIFPWTFGDSWSYVFIPSVPVQIAPSDPPKTLLLVIYPAVDAEAKRYTFQIRGNGTAQVTPISINLDILQYGDVTVIAPPSQAGNPGDTLEFNFEIKNTGNGKDRFQITAIEASVSAMAPYLKDNNNWTIDMNTGKSAIKTVVVALPWNLKTTEGTAGLQLSLTARSSFCQTQEDTNWTLIQALHCYDLSLGVSPPNATLLPGEMAEFTITLINLGNGYDNISLNISSTFDASAWTVSLARNRFYLAAERTNATTLKVVPPLNALWGTYILHVTARSSGPSFPQAQVQRTETLAIAIRQVRRILVPVTDFTSNREILPGEPVQFGFNFTNTGNVEDIFDLAVVGAPPNWTATLAPEKGVVVGPGTARSAVLTVTPSPDLNDSLHQTYRVTVRLATSDQAFARDLSFEVRVAPVHRFNLEATGGPSTEVNLFISNRQTVMLVLENRGNAPDNLSISLEGPQASWGRLDFPLVALARSEARVLRLELTVPPNAEKERTYILTILSGSLGSPGLFVERDLLINVRNFDPSSRLPRLWVYPETTELHLTEGDSLLLPVVVLCTGQDVWNISLKVTGGPGLNLTAEPLGPPRNLTVGERATFYVQLRAYSPGGALARGALEMQAIGQGVLGQKQAISITLQRAEKPPPVLSVEGLGIALAIFLTLGGIALGWNEVVLVALITLLLPLYVKLRKEEVLDQYTRGKIHGYIIANPGEHYNSIKAQLRLKNGTLAYHLRVLEREGFIQSSRDGMFKRFYPMEALVPRKRGEFSAIQEIVLENIRSSPGIAQHELARKMGVSTQVVNYHIRSLVTAGIVRLERDGRATRCHMK